MLSANYNAGPGDNGGVHTNSGVNNRAASLLTDGGTFNGKTVTALGITKVAKIYYEAQANLLTSASDYQDLHSNLRQACTNLTGTSGITAADCAEVRDAVDATEMNLIPTAAPNPEAPVCNTGQTATDLFFDDLENPASGNWIRTGNWFYPQNPNGIIDATYATSGTTNIWGYDQGSTGDYAISRTANVTPPTGQTTYLRFNHSYGFEGSFDGGVLEYSTGNGSTWNDAGPLITNNGYNGTLNTSTTNPLAGRQAFVSESNGYISSRVDLSSLAGQNVRFRFRIGTDSSVDDYGWFIDDVRVYTCVSDTTPPKVTSTVPKATATGVAPGANITATFSEAMDAVTTDGDPNTINDTTFKLFKAGTTNLIPAVVTYDASAKKAILNPNANLQRGTRYKAAVTTGAEDLAGNQLDQDSSLSGLQQKGWSFKTRN
jgi:hypothetical protein